MGVGCFPTAFVVAIVVIFDAMGLQFKQMCGVELLNCNRVTVFAVRKGLSRPEFASECV